MRLIFLFLSCLIAETLFSQDSVSLDQLQVPSSPAFTILDISPSSIERPKNPTDFALALGNATSGFTTLPKNYAMELAPYWVFAKKKATYDDFIADAPAKNILQTAVFSLGTKDAKSNIDSSEFRKIAFALKFSIWRGKPGSDFIAWNDSVFHYLGRISKLAGAAFIELQKTDKELNKLLELRKNAQGEEQNRLQQEINKRNIYLESNAEKIAQDSIKTYKEDIVILKDLMSRTDFKRYKFKMDYALGTAIDYPDSNFRRSYVSKFSTWLTLGFEKEKGLNWLGVLRYNYNLNRLYPNKINELIKDINIGELDYGVRIFSDVTTKLTLSFEILKRNRVVNKNKFKTNGIDIPENTDRYVFSANYKVGKNQNLSFTYGKNFDDTIVKDGNLITALNFLIGFGSMRPVK
jgi:hypothetical protein